VRAKNKRDLQVHEGVAAPQVRACSILTKSDIVEWLYAGSAWGRCRAKRSLRVTGPGLYSASWLRSPLVAMLPIPGRPLFERRQLIVRLRDGNDNAEKDHADGDKQQCEQPHHGFRKALALVAGAEGQATRGIWIECMSLKHATCECPKALRHRKCALVQS
jgi:hypothetical protein